MRNKGNHGVSLYDLKQILKTDVNAFLIITKQDIDIDQAPRKLRDKTMDNKLMYIHNYDKQN